MHDPMIVGFEIHSPFYKTRTLPNGAKWKDRATLITIWHNDPETDGSDDSCGWSRPNLTDREKKIIDELVEWEKEFPYYSSPYMPTTIVNPQYEYHQQLAGDCLAHVAGAWRHIAWTRDKRKKLTIGEWWEVVSLATNPNDNLRAILADPEVDPNYKVKHFFSCVMRDYLYYHRPWWKHPRWHIHHWKIQVHPVQKLKRWLFSRCAGCGKRFKWGYSPICIKWNNGGPRWFWSEENVYHREFFDPQSQVRKS